MADHPPTRRINPHVVAGRWVQTATPVEGTGGPSRALTRPNHSTELYGSLADGQALDRAVVEARQHLYAEKHGNWHLLRVYADKTPFTPMVTPLRTPERAEIQLRGADQDQAFLDPQTQLSRVASRATFVGRRRVIQRCLQILGRTGTAQALVLQGMGGLGKSSLASRLLERMPTHQRAVWYGRVDLTKFREFTTKVAFATMDQQIEATKLLDNEQAPLAVRLRFLLDRNGPLKGQKPCLFVFDDFEEGNLEKRAGGYVLSAEMAEILPALLTAIRETGSESRVIITSRYQFPAPAGTSVKVESLESLTSVEQTKKLANLVNLGPTSRVDPTIRARAIEAAGGNPRLLDWLDLILADESLDIDGLLTAIEGEADRFRRETILAQNLLDSQDPELQRMLAKVNVVELPIPAETVYAIHDHADAAAHVTRAAQLGLIEEGTDPETRKPRYFVSNVLSPLIRPLLTDDEYTQACAAAARSLYEIWVTGAAPADSTS